ncbi:hypothetical protein ACFQZE_16115 [Paenibacillus sp. GCM10027627]|uniref:hypothetical protein n=1 Tax=unclassified Paenibacillus TaxID=185978 RepID=UPI0036279028
MDQGWMTTLLLAFGIAVGVIGVIAYLRLFRKEKLAAPPEEAGENAPPSASNFRVESSGEREQTEGTDTGMRED